MVKNNQELRFPEKVEEKKVKKEVIEGFSGVRHEVHTVNVEGKKYILLDCRGMDEDEIRLELVRKTIVSFDTNLPLLLIVKKDTKLLDDIGVSLKAIKAKVIESD